MITEKDLHEAIAECQGERNPNANTCIKLAAYYTILNQITEQKPMEYSFSGYSAAAEPCEVAIASDSEFAGIVNGKNPDDIWPVVDELMTTLQVVNPRLYDSVIRKLYDRV